MEITLTSPPSALEVLKAAEMLIYESILSTEQREWCLQIIQAHREGQQ